MFSTLRTRFGIPGVISVIALVFAMFGGAFAANNSGSDNGAAASAKKSAKGPRGPKGPKGATGAAGPAGPAGPAGAKGDTGAAGANGAAGDKGATGANGVSVTSSAEPKGANCAEGGSKFVSSSGTTFACNGKAGKEGSPWTAGGALPSEATQTGVWGGTVTPVEPGEANGVIPISFPLPLEAGLDAAHVKLVTGTPPAECENPEHTGTASVENPEAEPGYLCVFAQAFFAGGEVAGIFKPTALGGIEGAGTTGAILMVVSTEAFDGGIGTFAVTAP